MCQDMSREAVCVGEARRRGAKVMRGLEEVGEGEGRGGAGHKRRVGFGDGRGGGQGGRGATDK